MNDIFAKYDLIDVDESFPIPSLPKQGIVLLVGSSGSGKSTIINKWFDEKPQLWQTGKPLYQEFSSPQVAEELLIACGLRTIPAWKRPVEQLSNGELHRAEIARTLDMGLQYVDEFTSVIDRDTAKALSVSVRKHFSRNPNKRLVLATPHRDIMEWLQPDAVYDTDFKAWLDPKERLRQPQIQIGVVPCETKSTWELFKKHHYLDAAINPAAYSWVALFGERPIAFSSILRFPNGAIKDGWREHRTVVLPEFQGMGIGTRLSETIGSFVLAEGGRYFSKTSHPAFGEHREKSPLWKPTSKNKKIRLDYKPTIQAKDSKDKMLHAKRLCYSHEFIGAQ